MNLLTEQELSLLFSANDLSKDCDIVATPKSDGQLEWSLQTKRRNGDVVALMGIRNRNQKTYRRLDLACYKANELGFENINVDMPKGAYLIK